MSFNVCDGIQHSAAKAECDLTERPVDDWCQTEAFFVLVPKHNNCGLDKFDLIENMIVKIDLLASSHVYIAVWCACRLRT